MATTKRQIFPVLEADRESVTWYSPNRETKRQEPTAAPDGMSIPTVAYIRFIVNPDGSFFGAKFNCNGTIEGYGGENVNDDLRLIVKADYWEKLKVGTVKNSSGDPLDMPSVVIEILFLGLRCSECKRFVRPHETYRADRRSWSMTCPACQARTGNYVR